MGLSDEKINELVDMYLNHDKIKSFKETNISQNNIKTQIIELRKGFDNGEVSLDDINKLLNNSYEIVQSQYNKFNSLLNEISNMNKVFSTGIIVKEHKFAYLKNVRFHLIELVDIFLNEKKIIGQALHSHKTWKNTEYTVFRNNYILWIKKEKDLYKKIESDFYNLLNEVRVKVKNMTSKKDEKLMTDFTLFLTSFTLCFWSLSIQDEHIKGVLSMIFSFSKKEINLKSSIKGFI